MEIIAPLGLVLVSSIEIFITVCHFKQCFTKIHPASLFSPVVLLTQDAADPTFEGSCQEKDFPRWTFQLFVQNNVKR